MQPITTMQIYWGAVPFVVIQCIMVALVIAIPEMVTFMLDRGTGVDPNSIEIILEGGSEPTEADQDAERENESDSDVDVEGATEEAPKSN
jgi:GntP family gluconate:H+ symporter